MMTAQEQMRKYRAKHPKYVAKENARAKLSMRKRREDPILREKFLKECREWRRNLRYEILSHYSGEQPKCAKCGYSDIRALCLDHINNDGASHRRRIRPNSFRGCGSFEVYSDLKKRGFPLGYQILCCNCNRIKEAERVVT